MRRKAEPVRSPRRQTKRDARVFVAKATGKPQSWKGARKWLKRQKRKT